MEIYNRAGQIFHNWVFPLFSLTVSYAVFQQFAQKIEGRKRDSPKDLIAKSLSFSLFVGGMFAISKYSPKLGKIITAITFLGTVALHLKTAKKGLGLNREEIKNLFLKEDEKEIQQILKQISDEEWRTLWFREPVLVDFVLVEHSTEDLSYLSSYHKYKRESEISEKQFLQWIKFASGRQLFILWMSTKSKDHIQWSLKYLNKAQEKELLSILLDYIKANHSIDLSCYTHFETDRIDQLTWSSNLHSLLIEISRGHPTLFETIVKNNAKFLGADPFAHALYFCKDDSIPRLLQVYLKETAASNVIKFFITCGFESKDENRGVKVGTRFVFLLDQAYQLLLSDPEIQKDVDQLKVEYREDEFFALAMMKYSFSNPKSHYFAKYLAQIPKKPDIFCSLILGYNRYAFPKLWDEEKPKEEIKQYMLDLIQKQKTPKEALQILIPRLKEHSEIGLPRHIVYLAKQDETTVVNVFVENIQTTVSEAIVRSWKGKQFEDISWKDYPPFEILEVDLSQKIFDQVVKSV